MGNFPTEKTPQELLNFWTDFAVNPPSLVMGLLGWNGSGYERILSNDNSIQVADKESKWDLITPTFNTTSDVYVFSLASVTVYTITINYTDATKETISSVTKV